MNFALIAAAAIAGIWAVIEVSSLQDKLFIRAVRYCYKGNVKDI